MNLPVILDIALGLVFIYLIASLLASELQELTATILQWRAKHLRESIQNLLAGGQGTAQDDQLGGFLETIYNDPLIRNMNQSSRGIIGSIGQWFFRYVLYRNRRVFGAETTAPSYIAPETFATALLERIGMATLIDKLTEIRLEKFVGRIVGIYDIQQEGSARFLSIPPDTFYQDKDYREKGSIRVLAEKAKSLAPDQSMSVSTSAILSLENNAEFKALVEEYDDLLNDFRSGEADLATCVERMKEGFNLYIGQISAPLTTAAIAPQPSATAIADPIGASTFAELDKQQLSYFQKRLQSFKLSTFGEDSERAIASGKLKPSLVEIAEVFDRASMTYQEIEGAYKDIAAAYTTGKVAQDIKQFLVAANYALKQRPVTPTAPKSLTKSLPDRTLTIADLADDSYQPAIADLVQQLSLSDRQIYKNWQTYQQSFSKIIVAIATCLQTMGQLRQDGELFASHPSNIDLNTQHTAVKASLKHLSDRDRADLTQNVLAQLSPADQQIYKGWQIYQDVILSVTRDIAHLLQEEERLFHPTTHRDFAQFPNDLDDPDLYQVVQYSLNLLSNEERRLRVNAATRKLGSEQRKIFNHYETYEQIQHLLSGVPTSVKQSLASLARRAQVKVKRTEDQLEQFNIEVAHWFDRSMSRASGVYKRNAKGVAILIGCLIAFVSNADTFHVVARLSGDDDLRQIIANRAGSITQNATTQELYSREQLRQLKRDTDAVLQEISLPLRWTPENLSQQFNCPDPTHSTDAPTASRSPWQTFYKTCLNEDNAPEQFDLFRITQIATRRQNIIDSARMFLGWLVSGLAIAMGAPFWFDLLSKIMNVRNTGSKPAPIADRETTRSGG
jgi:hypothetical protein